MKQIRAERPRARRERPWREALPADPRDPDIMRAKASPAPKVPASR